MIKVYNTKTNRAEYPCSVSEYLSEQLEGVTQETNYDSDYTSLNQGNFLPLLKLITEKLHAAKIISDQELLETLGGGYQWCSPYFKADEQ
jgi:hypothetical protein